MGIFGFYGAVFERAFLESVSAAQAIIFLMVAALGFFSRRLRDEPGVHARITSGRVALVILLALFCARVPFAIYDMWNDEHQRRLHAECLANQITDSRSERRQFVSQKLQSFYIRAQALLHRKITASDFPIWANEQGQLSAEMTAWIKSNMGDGAASKLGDMNGPTYDFAPIAISETHVEALNWLNKASSNLQILQERPEWDANAPQVAHNCD